MIVAWTGHRPYYFRDPRQGQRAVRRLTRWLRSQYGQDLSFLTGGQRGVDLWAAESGLVLGIPVRVVLPLPVDAFTHDWRGPDVERLRWVLERCASTEILGNAGAGEAAYTERNRRLATEAGLLVAVWTGVHQGGTWQTLKLARAAGTPVREVLLPGSERPLEPGKRGL
jgi:hypothetical protein